MEIVKFKNLEAELKRTGVPLGKISEDLNLSRATLYNRLKGHTDWDLSKMLQIQKYIEEKTGSKKTLDYLFQK